MGGIEFELKNRDPVDVSFNVSVRAGGAGGGIQSAQIDEIRVLTKSDYDALDEKDARTLYLLEG